jgi:glycosyltransferase involved in cell wall biosynthesis
MKNVLFVTHYFPPAPGPASQRHRHLAGNLPAYGWNPVVLTVKNSPTLKKNVPAEVPAHVEVHTVSPGNCVQFYYRWNAIRLLANKLIIPDVERVCLDPFRTTAARLLDGRSFDAIYTSCGPFSLALLGLWGKECRSLPWVLDYRDGWTLGAGFTSLTPWHRRRTQALESKLLLSCDHFVANTEGLLEAQRASWPFLTHKSSCVPNGVDPKDYSGLSPTLDKTDNPWRLLFVGTWYRKLYPPTLFRILQAFKARDPQFRWELHYSGSHSKEFIGLAQSHGLGRQTVDHGYLSHRETLQLMAGAKVLLLALPHDSRARYWIPAKLYEYLAVGRPVFGVVPPGDASRLLERQGEVASPDPQSADEGSKRLAHLFERISLRDGEKRDDTFFIKHGFSQLAGKLAMALDQATHFHR